MSKRSPEALGGSTRAFEVVAANCLVFFVLTLFAMLLYPGGRVGDADSTGYSFFQNFFSDLGQTHTHSGQSNLPSLVLFCLAIGATAFGIGLFFVAFTQLFGTPGGGRWLGRIAALCGIVTGMSFVGVALTPWNLYLQAHNDFVFLAFRSFLAAVVICMLAIFLTPGFPRRFAWVFAAFAVLLASYVLLLTVGPKPSSPEGAVVQATGQKIIVYASVLTVLVQALAARSLLGKRKRA